MEITSDIQVAVTQRKMKLLEDRVKASLNEPDADSDVCQLSRRSLKRMINQMKEEIARFEARTVAKT